MWLWEVQLLVHSFLVQHNYPIAAGRLFPCMHDLSTVHDYELQKEILHTSSVTLEVANTICNCWTAVNL